MKDSCPSVRKDKQKDKFQQSKNKEDDAEISSIMGGIFNKTKLSIISSTAKEDLTTESPTSKEVLTNKSQPRVVIEPEPELREVISQLITAEYHKFLGNVQYKYEKSKESIFKCEMAKDNNNFNGMNTSWSQKEFTLRELSFDHKVWSNLYQKYLMDCKSASIKHVFLPVIIRFLLNIKVASVNTEITFSKMKKIYGKHRHCLKDETSEDEILVADSMRAFEDEFLHGSNLEDGLKNCFKN